MKLSNFYRPGEYKMPPRIILGLDKEFRELKQALLQPEIPTIDIDVLMTHIVEACRSEKEAEVELFHLPQTLVRYEVLGARVVCDDLRLRSAYCDTLDDPWENILGLEIVMSKAVKTGRAFYRTLKELRIFENQYLQFDYDGVLNDQSILLRRRG